jgi:hypothetical protein
MVEDPVNNGREGEGGGYPQVIEIYASILGW